MKQSSGLSLVSIKSFSLLWFVWCPVLFVMYLSAMVEKKLFNILAICSGSVIVSSLSMRETGERFVSLGARSLKYCQSFLESPFSACMAA